MKKEYKIELTVVIDDANRQHLIALARDCMPGVRAITVDDALLELVQNHPAFEEASIEVDSISCTTEEDAAEFVERALNGAGFDPSSTRETADNIPPDDAGAELDDYDTGVYLCRWPNGDFSVVTADSKRDAIIALDEWAGAHCAPQKCRPTPPDWLWLSRVGSVRGSRRGLLQGVFMMQAAQNRRAANNVPGGDAMAVPIRRRGMRGCHRYPRTQTHVRSAVVEMRDP